MHSRERSRMPRRGFLSGLASTPLIGGAIAATMVLPKVAEAATVADPIPALYAEKVRATALINGGHVTEEEADRLMDVWGACDAQAIAAPAATSAGAVASIQWARQEILEFGFDHLVPNKGARLVLSLLDGALGVLRNQTAKEPKA